MSHFTSVQSILDHIAGRLPLVEKSDLSVLVSILCDFEKFDVEPDLPQAFKTLAKRSVKLINTMISGEIDFNAGYRKLSECVDKLAKGLFAFENKNEEVNQKINKTSISNDENVTKPDTSASPLLEEIKDLIIKFASNQQIILEDFEALILDLDKGGPRNVDQIKRILHTWKGEFGVLDLSEYSALIHEVEEKLENRTLTVDNLFRLKDFLSGRISQLASGKYIPVSRSDRETIFEPSGCDKRIEPNCKTEPEKHDKQKVKQESPPESKPHSPENVPVYGGNPFTGEASMMGDFITESRDHLSTAETLLLELETDPTNIESINTVFRSWHTIKGVAGCLGLKEINSMAHSMESLMDKVRKKEIVLNSGHIDLLLASNDSLKDLLAAVEKAVDGLPFQVPDSYSSLMNRLTDPSVVCSIPSSIPVVPPDKKIGEILIDSGVTTHEDVKNALTLQVEGDKRRIGEILIQEKDISSRIVGSALATQTASRQVKSIEETIRVPVLRIDQLVDTIGEAVIAESMIYAHPTIASINDSSLHTKIAHANSILRSIQELAMSLRMVSVKSTFQKMARLARDLSKKCDRDIDFVTEGEDTELDKSVVENIGDPLIHMIRNAIDHGIESREERRNAGKPAKATVKLKAYHRAGSIFVEVSDDGKGLDKTAILQKAISKGICKSESNLTDQEIYQCIFLPGFSTAKIVTDVSGRGVGMDVVRRNIEALRGSVEISTTPGKGTTFTIRLPLTLAVVDGMIVQSCNNHYIIPTLAIVESLRPDLDQIDTVMEKCKMIKVRDELIQLVHLDLLLSNNKNKWDFSDGIVMIVEDMFGKKIGLYVDEILGQQQVVIKSLSTELGDIAGVTGGAIMSDGRVSLILDIGGIVKMAEG